MGNRDRWYRMLIVQVNSSDRSGVVSGNRNWAKLGRLGVSGRGGVIGMRL